MKLIRFGEAGMEKPGVIIGEKKYDVSSFVRDYDEEFFNDDGIRKLEKTIAQNHLTEVD